jgi:hypothetical protein
LKHLLIHSTTLWSEIEFEMQDLANCKVALETQIATRKKIAEFVADSKKDGNPNLQGRLQELDNLEKQLAPRGLVMQSQVLCHQAEQHIQAIKLGEDITQFLDQLAGTRGQHALSGNYYDEEMQSRINSLQNIEQMCIGTELPNIDHYKSQAEAHKQALLNWSESHDVSVQFYGKYENAPDEQTFEQREAISNDKQKRLTQHEQSQKIPKLRQKIADLAYQLYINESKLSERNEHFAKLGITSGDLQQASKVFAEKAEHFKNEQTLLGKIKNRLN